VSQAKYGVLLVAGDHTHQEMYAPAFAADRRCALVAVTDEPGVDARRRRLNERMAKRLKIPHIGDLEKALRHKDVSLVSVCAEPERRGRIAVRCAEAGKDLYLDKSLEPTLAGAGAIVQAVKKAGVTSHMFSFVSQPWARRGKEAFDKGAAGKLLAVHADCFFAKGRPGTAKLGSPRKEEYPLGRHQLIDAKREWDNVGVYPITLIHWLTGKNFATVFGSTANYFFAEHQKRDVEDFGLLAGTLEDGVPVTVSAGRYGWTSHPAGGVNRVVLVGSERTLVLDANRPRLEVYCDEKPWSPPAPHPDDPMFFWSTTQAESGVRPKQTWVPIGPAATDASYFLDCLDAGRDSEMSVVPAAHATEVLLATYLSAKTGEVVSLPLKRG
jgi:predicted dehydrogenase